MKYLLDTHVVIWALTEDPRLSPAAVQMISSSDNLIFFSGVSLWEIAIKNAKSPLKCPYREADILRFCLSSGMEPLDILTRHILALRTLETREDSYLSNQDPFDRMLIAQAKTEGMILLSHDSNLANYRESCILMI